MPTREEAGDAIKILQERLSETVNCIKDWQDPTNKEEAILLFAEVLDEIDMLLVKTTIVFNKMVDVFKEDGDTDLLNSFLGRGT